MAHVIVQNSRNGEEPIAPSRNEDGRFFEFGMYYDGGALIAWADDFAEFVEVLNPGYLEQSEQDQLITRVGLALRARTTVQAEVYADASDEDIAALTPEQDALINGTHTGRPVIEDWTSEIPLVLVATAYQPHTDTPRPVSSYGPYLEVPNMWWINPEDDESLMQDLHEIGYIQIVTTTDPTLGAAEG